LIAIVLGVIVLVVLNILGFGDEPAIDSLARSIVA
jgi:hypothetical protein